MSNSPKTQSQIKTPLLKSIQIQIPHEHQEHEQEHEQHEQENHNLDESLQRLDFYLLLLGFNQTSYIRLIFSWTMFLMIGVLVPVLLVLLTTDCYKCDLYQVVGFELVVVSSHACLAASALLCLSHNLRKYGIRKFLFVDQDHGHVQRFSTDYVLKISESKRALVTWFLPCVILKIIREVMRVMYMHHGSWWRSFGVLLTLTFSWTYVTLIFFASCIVFHLVCNLQIIHFDDYGDLLERETDVLVYVEEHARLRNHLSKISHRFRIYLLLVFIVVTSSQFATLFLITDYEDMVTFINGGDFAVSSIAQVVGVIICLNAASKISHRAQGIAALASRWHALTSCGPDETFHMRFSTRIGNMEAASHLLRHISSESDLESMSYSPRPSNTQITSHLSSYHRRQSFQQRRWHYFVRLDSGPNSYKHNLLHPAFTCSLRSGKDNRITT